MMDSSLVVENLNIAELNDNELLDKLQGLGFNAGPITDTTRVVYQRKLARLMRNEEFEGLEDENEPIEGNYPESPNLNTSFDSFRESPSINTDFLRRRPLSRVEGERWLEGPPVLSPHKPWNSDDIVTQERPPPEEDEKPYVSSTTMVVVIVALLLFVFIVYYNMESSPQTPFS